MHSTSTSVAATVPDHRATVSRNRRWRWFLFAGGLVLAGALVAARGRNSAWFHRLLGGDPVDASALYTVEPTRLDITLTETGELRPRKSVKLKCEVDGQPSILFVVDESTHVRKGDLLIELTSESLTERLESEQMEVDKLTEALESAKADLEIQLNQNQSDIEKAQIDVEVAELDLKKYIEGDFQQRLKEIELDIQRTNMDIERKKIELDENTELLERGWVTQVQVDQIKYALDVLEMELARHNEAKRILLEYEKPMNLKQKQSALNRARAALEDQIKRAKQLARKKQSDVDRNTTLLKQRRRRLAKYEEQLKNCKIVAPCDGVVQYPNEGGWRFSSNTIAVGETVRKGQTLLELPDTSQMIVKTRIHEADRHLVREGMPCLITVTAAPGKTFTGKISKIDKFVDTENRWLNPNLKEHGAEILLDPTEVPLSPGESAEVRIIIASIDNALAVPVQCVFSRGARSFVFVDNGSGPQLREVRIGRANPTLVEVVEGLQAGDHVLMQADPKLIAMLPEARSAPATSATTGKPGVPRAPRRKARPPSRSTRPRGRRGGATRSGR